MTDRNFTILFAVLAVGFVAVVCITLIKDACSLSGKGDECRREQQCEQQGGEVEVRTDGIYCVIK